MNREASELMKIAKDLMSMDFSTKNEYDKYMKDHPDADRSKHHLVETKPSGKPSVEKKDTGVELGQKLNGWVKSFNSPSIGPTQKRQLEDLIDQEIFERKLDPKKVYGK